MTWTLYFPVLLLFTFLTQPDKFQLELPRSCAFAIETTARDLSLKRVKLKHVRLQTLGNVNRKKQKQK